jgi:hypothetical protein
MVTAESTPLARAMAGTSYVMTMIATIIAM